MLKILLKSLKTSENIKKIGQGIRKIEKNDVEIVQKTMEFTEA